MSECLTAVPVILFTWSPSRLNSLVCKKQMKPLSANTYRTELHWPPVLEKVMYMCVNLEQHARFKDKKHEIFAE